jgi:hypothetical protein
MFGEDGGLTTAVVAQTWINLVSFLLANSIISAAKQRSNLETYNSEERKSRDFIPPTVDQNEFWSNLQI